MKVNRLDEASAMFERASKVAPRVYHPRLNLGIVVTRRGEYKEARFISREKVRSAIQAVEQYLAEVPLAPNAKEVTGDRKDEACIDSKVTNNGLAPRDLAVGRQSMQ
jgi:hypothetical protein